MAQATIPSDLFVAGNLASKTMTIPANTVTDANIQALAGIQAGKVFHQHEKVFCQPSGTASVSEQRVVHVTFGATGTIVGYEAGAVVPCVGADTISVDLLKNGTSILTAVISLTNAQTARQLVTGSLSSTSTVATDVFEVKITANHSTGTLAQEVFAMVTIQEAPQ